MSNTLAEFENIPNHKDGKNMTITATVQGIYGGGVQFTIGMEYCVLSENQINTLIKLLKYRLECKKGYSATDESERRYVPATFTMSPVEHYGKKAK